MEQRLSFVTLGVKDVARARSFYERLGLHASPKSNEHVTFFQMNGLMLGLWSWDELALDAQLPPAGSGFRGVALAYNVRERADVDVLLREVEDAGGKILKPAREVFWGGYSGYFADVDDHVWEVAWNPGGKLDSAGNFSM